MARGDTLTSAEQLGEALAALQAAGVTGVVLYPTSSGLDRVGLLAEAFDAAGVLTAPHT